MASEFHIRLASAILQHGGIICYKTDTLYGLSGDPYNAAAVQRISDIKQRPGKKSFILIASHVELFYPLLPDPVIRQAAILSNNTEPTSWIVTARKTTPVWLKADDGSIAIRISRDPITEKLCQRLQRPLVSSSANISGRRAINSALQCHRTFGRQVEQILISDHDATGRPSRLVRLCDNKILRSSQPRP